MPELPAQPAVCGYLVSEANESGVGGVLETGVQHLQRARAAIGVRREIHGPVPALTESASENPRAQAPRGGSPSRVLAHFASPLPCLEKLILQRWERPYKVSRKPDTR